MAWNTHTSKAEALYCVGKMSMYLSMWSLVKLQLTAGGVESGHFPPLGDLFASKFDIVIPKTPLYEGMAVGS